jgi:hypothetical protein
LHRVILGYSGPDEVDHINGDRTDNRKANLRVASKLTNQYNRKRWKPGLKGAYARGSRWVSAIKLPGDKQQTYLGTFDTAEAAHAAYVAAANEHFGEYARAA